MVSIIVGAAGESVRHTGSLLYVLYQTLFYSYGSFPEFEWLFSFIDVSIDKSHRIAI